MQKHFLFLTLVISILFVSCRNQATVDNSLKQYFDKYNVDGSFALLNNISGKVTVYNLAKDTTRFLPASTFKIVSSLIGLETGVIENDTMVIKWDGVSRWNNDWNKDLQFNEAFKLSSVPYFQEVARRIGKDTMQFYLDSIKYGNMVRINRIDSFWLDNTLKISPDEQLGLVKRLYFDQLPFRKSVMQSVRDVMLQESNTQYQLSYKTGFGYNEKNETIGWVVGWIEENRHVYFFSTLLHSPNKDFDMKTARIAITKDILKSMGFFEGKK